MLRNEYFVAKIDVDTAKNEPSKVRGFLLGVGGIMGKIHFLINPLELLGVVG